MGALTDPTADLPPFAIVVGAGRDRVRRLADTGDGRLLKDLPRLVQETGARMVALGLSGWSGEASSILPPALDPDGRADLLIVILASSGEEVAIRAGLVRTSDTPPTLGTCRISERLELEGFLIDELRFAIRTRRG